MAQKVKQWPTMSVGKLKKALREVPSNAQVVLCTDWWGDVPINATFLDKKDGVLVLRPPKSWEREVLEMMEAEHPGGGEDEVDDAEPVECVAGEVCGVEPEEVDDPNYVEPLVGVTK